MLSSPHAEELGAGPHPAGCRDGSPSYAARTLASQPPRDEAEGHDQIDPDLIFAPIGHAKKLLLAVSGGPDSIALMLLAARWSRRATIAIEIAIVDHRLRSGSRAEAEAVASWARALGFPHRILTWDSERPRTRVQERAREARYRLLEACAAHIGADHIVTAHHADDQAETVLMRLTRGSGPAGLAGMALLTRLGEVTLARPLLGVPKANLVKLCDVARHPYFCDASNENPAFARTRLRTLRDLLQVQGLDRASLLRLARRAARAEAALAGIAESARWGLSSERSAGKVKVAGQVLARLPEEIFLRVLEAEILGLSPHRDRLRLNRLERAAMDVAAALREKRGFATTLGGARLAVTAGGELEIARAPARRTAPRSA